MTTIDYDLIDYVHVKDYIEKGNEINYIKMTKELKININKIKQIVKDLNS